MEYQVNRKTKYKDLHHHYMLCLEHKCTLTYSHTLRSYNVCSLLKRQLFTRKKDARLLGLVLDDQASNRYVFGKLELNDLIKYCTYSEKYDANMIKLMIDYYEKQGKLCIDDVAANQLFYAGSNIYIIKIINILVDYDCVFTLYRYVIIYHIYNNNASIIKFIIDLLIAGKILLDKHCDNILINCVCKRNMHFIKNRWETLKIIFDYHCDYSQFFDIRGLFEHIKMKYYTMEFILDNYADKLRHELEGVRIKVLAGSNKEKIVDIFDKYKIKAEIIYYYH